MLYILTALSVCLFAAGELTGEITDFSLVQSDMKESAETTYTINFQPITAIPAAGSLKIGWPD